MKKFILLLLFAIEFSVVGFAQTAASGKGEKSHKHKKTFTPMASHFDHSTKKDKLLGHNGTTYYMNKHNNYIVDANAFGSRNTHKKGKHWRKVKNKMFGTYMMKA